MSAQAPAFKNSWIIGSSDDCDIVVADAAVSGRHCRLSLHGERFVAEDLGSTNGTYINGHRLQPNQQFFVSPQDEITLGRRVPMPWPGSGNTVRSAPDAAPDAEIITIGRSPANHVRLDFEMVSWTHARIFSHGTGWIIEDLDSRNGTALNRIDNKIRRAPLLPEDEIFLGSYKISANRILTKKHLTQGEDTFERVNFRGEQMVLGRDPSCDYPLDYPMISWRHAELRRTADGIYVEDLGSRNGTFVNGERISGKTLIRPGQEIGLGSFRFQFLEDGGLVKREYTGNVTIEVCGVAVNAPTGDPLLDPISLTIFPSELIALMGPAGAGKTTFLKSLNGYTPPAAGRVLFNGADLYQFYDRFRTQMSYVPQDDIVHAQLTVREALYFSAKLRTDLKDEEIGQRIDKVLEGLGIPDKKNTVIGSPEKKVLSGGQRKRVNIAMELINDTPVIFLDEPTSGLSSYDAEGVIQMLKALSKEGKTIITTIHQPSTEIFRQFDGLIMIGRDRGGRGALAYFGPAHPESIEFFDPDAVKALRRTSGAEPGPELLLSGLKKRTTAEWAAAYTQSRFSRLYVTDRSGKIPSTPAEHHSSKREGRGFGPGQWWTLVRRNVILKVRDRAQVIILLIQAPLFAVLVGGVFGRLKVEPPVELKGMALKAPGIEFLLVVAAIWFGCNNAARDIVGEWTVYQRERMVSLKLPSYVLSKLTVAALLCFFQCSVLLGIVRLMCDLKGDFLQTLGVLYLASLVGAALGLCVSAVAPTTEAAIAMLPLILLPVIALGGGIHTIRDMPEPMPRIAQVVPSRWAFEAILSLESQSRAPLKVDLSAARFPVEPDRNSVKKCAGVLAAMFAVWLAAVLGVLKKRDVV